jgi:hypothetical protein
MHLNVNTSQAIKATERFFDLLDKILDKNYILEPLTIILTAQEHSKSQATCPMSSSLSKQQEARRKYQKNRS